MLSFRRIICVLFAVFFVCAAAALIIVYDKYGKAAKYSSDADVAIGVTWAIIFLVAVIIAIYAFLSYRERKDHGKSLTTFAAQVDAILHDFKESGPIDEEKICCPRCGGTHCFLGDHDNKSETYSFICKKCKECFTPPIQMREASDMYAEKCHSAKFSIILSLLTGILFLVPIILLNPTKVSAKSGTMSWYTSLMPPLIIYAAIVISFIVKMIRCYLKAQKLKNDASELEFLISDFKEAEQKNKP